MTEKKDQKPYFAETVVLLQLFVRCHKCGAYLRVVDKEHTPVFSNLYVDTEHKCKGECHESD